MTRRRAMAAGLIVLVALGALAAAYALSSWRRPDRETPEELRRQIAALEAERTVLRERLEALVVKDPRLAGMPEAPVRLAVPTTLAGDLITRVLSGVVGQVTLDLRNLRVRKQGSVRRVVPLGDYDVRVTVNRVTGTLQLGTPSVRFGGNRVALALPLRVAAGTGNATIDFTWDGRTIGGAVCGDMAVTQVVTGRVRPRTYPVSGSLTLTSTATEILVEPHLPRLRVNLGVVPSEESWRAAQKILDDKGGVCGFVLDRVDVMGMVKRLVDRGFNVRLPTERVKAVALPVGVEPTLTVRGEPVALGITVGGLTITEHAIWLGAHVSVAMGDEALTTRAAPAARGTTPRAGPRPATRTTRPAP